MNTIQTRCSTHADLAARRQAARRHLVRRRAVRFAALAALAGLSPLAQAETCTSTSERQIAGLFDRWNASLATLDPRQVTAQYAPDAVLLPTVSNQPRTSPAGIQDYFVTFLKKGPQGHIDQRTIKIGCNVAQDVGTYTFTFKDGQEVHARYTYVYEWRNGRWLIAHHHSSAMPEPTSH